MNSEVIATLGPRYSCSDIVAKRNLRRFTGVRTVRLFPTYELAFEAVENDHAGAAMVAAAYPRLNELVMKLSRSVVIIESFVDDTPALVIAARDVEARELTGEGKTIACVGAPAPLVSSLFPKCHVVPASSNSDAALFAADGRVDAALTTEPAAIQSNLRVLHSFGSIPMAWVIFKKRRNQEQSVT
jgi:hypothetical protein